MNHTPKSPPEHERSRWLDDPRNVRRLVHGFFYGCALVATLDVVFVLRLSERHVEFSFEQLPLFHCIFGLVACVTLVLVAKQLRRILKRDEKYYDR